LCTQTRKPTATIENHSQQLSLHMKVYFKIFFTLLIMSLVAVVTFLPVDVKTEFIENILVWFNIVVYEKTPFGIWFSELTDNSIATYLLINNLGHIIIFALFGYLLGHLDKHVPKYILFVLLIIITGGSEFLQHFVAGRQPDLDDLILNVIAGITGYSVYKQIHYSHNRHN